MPSIPEPRRHDKTVTNVNGNPLVAMRVSSLALCWTMGAVGVSTNRSVEYFVWVIPKQLLPEIGVSIVGDYVCFLQDML